MHCIASCGLESIWLFIYLFAVFFLLWLSLQLCQYWCLIWNKPRVRLNSRSSITVNTSLDICRGNWSIKMILVALLHTPLWRFPMKPLLLPLTSPLDFLDFMLLDSTLHLGVANYLLLFGVSLNQWSYQHAKPVYFLCLVLVKFQFLCF